MRRGVGALSPCWSRCKMSQAARRNQRSAAARPLTRASLAIGSVRVRSSFCSLPSTAPKSCTRILSPSGALQIQLSFAYAGEPCDCCPNCRGPRSGRPHRAAAVLWLQARDPLRQLRGIIENSFRVASRAHATQVETSLAKLWDCILSSGPHISFKGMRFSARGRALAAILVFCRGRS